MELCPLSKPHKTVTNGLSKSAIQCTFHFFIFMLNPIHQYVVYIKVSNKITTYFKNQQQKEKSEIKIK